MKKIQKGERPLILITNDDGVEAKGVNELATIAAKHGDVVVVAPDGPRSGQSSAITSNMPLRLKKVKQQDNIIWYSCNGTPVDCVKLSLHRLFDERPSLLLSGINHGLNSGVSIIYSGTMGAALEGCLIGIPSIGFSLDNHSADADFSNCKDGIDSIITNTLDKGLSSDVCLNINFPKGEFKKFIVCRQARGYWSEEYIHRVDPSNKKYFWLTGFFKNLEPENPETDEYQIKQGNSTIVPCHVDMTAHETISQFKQWIK